MLFLGWKSSYFHLNFTCILFIQVQLKVNQHWLRLCLGAKQARSHYLNQWWLSALIHVPSSLNGLMYSSPLNTAVRCHGCQTSNFLTHSQLIAALSSNNQLSGKYPIAHPWTEHRSFLKLTKTHHTLPLPAMTFTCEFITCENHCRFTWLMTKNWYSR